MEQVPAESALAPAAEPSETTPETTQRKGKRRPEDDLLDEPVMVDQNPEAPPKAKRSKRSERPQQAAPMRPIRERRQSSYSISRGFLDDKAFESMELRTSKIEQRRAAFYDTQSYRACAFIRIPPRYQPLSPLSLRFYPTVSPSIAC